MSDEKIVEQAIDWMLQLEQPDVSPAERAAFERWRAADPRNDVAYANLTQSVRQFDVPRQVGASATVLRNTLQQKKNRRKTLKRIAALAGLTVGAGALLNQVTPLRGMSADLHTGTGERQTYTLADGSVLTLNARSAADRLIDQSRRLVRLFAGEMYLQVAAQGRLPFAIETRHGSASALSGTLLIRYLEERTQVVALQASAMLQPLEGQGVDLPSGRRTWFDRTSIASLQQISGRESSWIDGYYTASNAPLTEVIEALRPYRKGMIRLEPAAGELRVSGAFPLDDTDRALSALANNLPIEVTRVTPYWVTISARA
ncbi:MAG: Protein FecR [Herbaspirillum frisingense]|uniref:Protein FecR n=1 Tax=Herbaspirillum frisingense TaxID=92645 RepID=A0A7V8FTT2_9BURK|nr:MAG: Protein FecR [Herbaspirillum frisingense]